MLDPIADKLLVAAVLLALAADHTISGPSLWAAIVILCREILVSGLREYLAELQRAGAGDGGRQVEDRRADGRARLPHRRAGRRRGLPAMRRRSASWLLWIAAILTFYTGWDYMRASYDHVGGA